jgi:hypothetical protein
MDGAMNPGQALEQLATLPPAERAGELLALAPSVNIDGLGGDVCQRLVAGLLEVLDLPVGTGKERLQVGELLGQLGDPRIVTPGDEDYWVSVEGEAGEIVIGRFPVTNQEFRRFVEAGGYDDATYWSSEGWEWRQSCNDPWPVRADAEQSKPFVISNQPVVGVTYFEAEAYAQWAEARLPRREERTWVMRGQDKRPYPWGQPFGEGNANTLEEVLGRPCAVGLYVQDRTPEGVCDLAGNAAEWTSDSTGEEQVFHPGAWDQPSLAAWAKAIESEPRDARWAGLGFRLARDA